MAKNLFTRQALLAAAVFISLCAFALTYADTRESLRSGSDTRTVAPAPSPVPAPAFPPPPPPSGGITSDTVGEIDTGHNTGGTVTTGDDSIEVHEVNIGPTNPPPPPAVTPTPTPAPQPSCDGRSRDCAPDRSR